ncbi:hypothetical protein [Parasphingopyxis sp.]|uniref:hypothetical protein n=1 Tax=Parasphingopyxis sp. TaxID=1920299 RepID=UPI0026282CB9|nr:hypothetical protein [Parasphingopyxis sp.]
MAAWFRLLALSWLALAMPAMAQLDTNAGAAIPPPGELAFAIPEQFHGRWVRAETGCAAGIGSTETIIAATGLQRGNHWSEPVALIEQSADGRRLAMRADLYFQAPPVLHRSVWQLSADGNGLVITDSELPAAGEEEGGPVRRVELVRCGS